MVKIEVRNSEVVVVGVFLIVNGISGFRRISRGVKWEIFLIKL